MDACASRHVGRAPLLAALVATAGVLAGCGSGEKLGEVEGTVTFKGQPVKEGTVIFQKEGAMAEAPLDQNGRYVMKPPQHRLPPGEYQVTVMPLMYLEDPDPKHTPPALVLKRAPNIPEKYRYASSTLL